MNVTSAKLAARIVAQIAHAMSAVTLIDADIRPQGVTETAVARVNLARQIHRLQSSLAGLLCPTASDRELAADTEPMITLRLPVRHWQTLRETLERDSHSCAFDSKLRKQITTALGSIKELQP